MATITRFLEKWSNWELWPMGFRYFPITPVWVWYTLRSQSFWFFTPSNPTVSFGGFEGETKKEIYEQLPQGTYPQTAYIDPAIGLNEVQRIINEHNFVYPFVVKPQVGMGGLLFRVIENFEQLKTYHLKSPANYLIQAFVEYPVEFSVFYYRYPNQQKGVITGFLRKELLDVTGDGISTLQQLILKHPVAKHRMGEFKSKHSKKLNSIIPAGERFCLSYAANLSRGGRFINLEHEIDDKLHQVFDNLNTSSKTFYYGRYDLKAASVEDLKEGKNFLILEYNGSGAEPNHIYNSNYTLLGAYAEIIKHWKVLYEISRYNKKQGINYYSFSEGYRILQESKRHLRLLKKCDCF